ncbi:MAG TPA: hypothetical protein VHQ66_15825 [Myxococcota bacterium]|nr:hypothetical protein [Myxococcota bacterium]
MGRRRFDHLFVETCVAAGRRLPRLALWHALHEAGADPERLGREEALAFARDGLVRFLEGEGIVLRSRERARLERELRRYDPARPTPYERFAAYG